MKRILNLGLAFLLITLVAFAANLDAPSEVVIQGQQGVTATATFNLQNTHATDNITLSSSDFSFDPTKFKDDEDTAVISFSSPGPIIHGSSVSVTATAVISSKLDKGSYSGTVAVNKDIFNDTFTLKVIVNPDVCDEGIKPNPPNLEIADWELKKNPETDEKDEYYAGDKIVIQDINVENNGDNEITDIIVEAILYDLSDGDELDSVKSDSFNLDDGKDKDIEDLELTVPTDIDEENDFAVFLKVYEDGDEDKNCNFKSALIDVKKRSRDMAIDLTSINPQTAKCGDYVDFNINVKNIGSKDDSSVYVKIQDPALKITGQTASFSLDSDYDTTKSVRIKVLEDLASGVYSIEAVVVYSGTTPRSDFGNLTISCETNKAPVANAGSPQSVQTGNIVTLNGAGSTDADDDQLTYLWTQVSGLAVQLSNPTSSVTTFTPTVADTYVFKLEVSDGQEKSSATTSVTVTAPATTGATTYQPSSAFDVIFKKDSLQKATWIVAIVVLVLIAVYLLKLIFNPVKKRPQQPTPEPEFP